MKSVTCTAPVNIAVIKYWGKRDTELILPTNDSLSVTLSQDILHSKTSIAASNEFTQDRLWLNGKEEDITKNRRMHSCFRETRALRAKMEQANASLEPLSSYKLHVCSENNFPTAAGLASSASGLAALVYTLAQLFELDISTSELTRIARQGSGSACRSLFGGFVAWQMGQEADGSDSLAYQVAPESHWPELEALICVVSDAKKGTSSTTGMQNTIETSPLMAERLRCVPGRMEAMKKAIQERDFQSFAELTMRDSNQFHAVCLDTYPPISYQTDTSRAIMALIHEYNKSSPDGGSDATGSRPTSSNYGYSMPGTPVSDSNGNRLSMTSTTQTAGTGMASASTTTTAVAAPQYVAELSEFQTVVADIPPLEHVVYSKEIQTAEGSFDVPQKSEEEIRQEIMEEIEQLEKQRQAQLEEERKRAEQEKNEETPDLSVEEKKIILTSPEFLSFVDTSSKFVERALNETYDFMKDYTLGVDVDSDENTGKRVKFMCDFWDEKWSRNRSVTDVNWSNKYPELLVSSYNKNPATVNDPDGVALVWNLHLLERPEFVFHSQSDVLSVMFSKFHPNYVIGGTYSGQIVLWDTRAKSLPVLKTPLSAGGHTHPVYSLEMVGTQNAHNLITASTDGFVCSWQLDMLAQPQDYLELLHPSHNKTDEVSVTCLGFPDNETTTFWVGTEEGNVYQAGRYDQAGSKAGINQADTYKGHYGAVTGLHFHPLFGSVDFSDLFLTSSVDWTVKLWRSKSASKSSSQPTEVVPLYSFEHADDYVYDVKWSPSHPALFGSVDGTGQFDLWNLNADTEEPYVSTSVGSGRALNKLAWDKEGNKTAIGSSDGRVYLYDIGEIATPKQDEWHLLQKNVSEMIANQENPGK